MTMSSRDEPGALLDANALIALTVIEHEHHDAARTWFTRAPSVWLCAISEGALVRFLLRLGESSAAAASILAALGEHPKVGFISQAPSYRDVDLTGIRGHQQVTDVYLASLAESADVRLATFDNALAALRPNSVELIPT